MSPRSFLSALALLAAAVVSLPAQGVAPAPGSEMPAAPEPQLKPEEIFEVFGWIAADQNNLTSLGLSETEIAAFVKGLTANAHGENPPANINQVVQVAQTFLQDRAKEVSLRSAVPNQEEEAREMAKLDANPAVKKTESGLRYEIIEPGTGTKPAAADTVVAHYTLSFPDGTVKESSHTTGDGKPAEFSLARVIPAWTEGLQLIGAGGHIKLYVPSALGYGPTGSPNGIPPAKMLVFDVELVNVKPAAPAPVAMPQAMPTPTPAPN